MATIKKIVLVVFKLLAVPFLLFSTSIQAYLNGCTTLSRECCWKPSNESSAWQRHESIDQAWYRRIFRSRILRPPPAKAYYSSVLSKSNYASTLESCSYCSQSGNVRMWIRHWTSPSAQIHICWKQKLGLDDLTECRQLDSARNGLIDSEQIAVQRNIPVSFFVRIRSNNLTTIPPAVLVDFLNVRSEPCSLKIQKLKSGRFVLPGVSHLRKLTTTTLSSDLDTKRFKTPDPREIESFFNEDSVDDQPSSIVKIEATTPTQLVSSQQNGRFFVPWTTARNMDFLVPQIGGERRVLEREWTAEQRGIQDSPAADYSLKPRAPLSFSNMLGMQLPPQDPMSSKADSGLKIRPVEKAEIVGQITPTPQFREIHESNDLPSKEHSAWQKEEMAALKKSPPHPEIDTYSTTPSGHPVSTTLPPKLFNPFADLFGEEFANFLDPSFNTTKYDELEIRHEQQQSKKMAEKFSGIVNQRRGDTRTVNRLQIKGLPAGNQSISSVNRNSQVTYSPRKPQHKTNTTLKGSEQIGSEGPDPYRRQPNLQVHRPPTLLAIQARLFSVVKNTSKEEEEDAKDEKATFVKEKISEARFIKVVNATRESNVTRESNDDIKHQHTWSSKKHKQCNYTGGCLFEKSTCNFTNSRTLSSNSQFKRVSVGSSNFVEARIGAGDVAVFESHVNASGLSFYMLFDYLEWTEGEKLSACCHTPGRQPIELYCPFESSTNERDIRWEGERIKCEPETTRILFICENYGYRTTICALDNIRLHADWDKDFEEPCQSDQLLSL